MANLKKTVKKGKKVLGKVMKSKTAKETARREKVLASEMLIKSAKKLKEQAKKK